MRRQAASSRPRVMHAQVTRISWVRPTFHIQGAAMYQGRFYLSSSLPKLGFPFSLGRFL